MGANRLACVHTLGLSFTFVLSILLAASQKLPCDSKEVNMAGNRERTFIMLKPDAVQRGLVGEIIKRFEQKGFKLVAMKMMHASEELLKEHYADLSSKGFFPGLVKYMNSGPVVPMVWEGLNVVKTGRVMLGEQTLLHLLPVQFVAISVSRLDVIFAMVLMLLSL